MNRRCTYERMWVKRQTSPVADRTYASRGHSDAGITLNACDHPEFNDSRARLDGVASQLL
jgi:hypothetical protein